MLVICQLPGLASSNLRAGRLGEWLGHTLKHQEWKCLLKATLSDWKDGTLGLQSVPSTLSAHTAGAWRVLRKIKSWKVKTVAESSGATFIASLLWLSDLHPVHPGQLWTVCLCWTAAWATHREQEPRGRREPELREAEHFWPSGSILFEN